MLLTSRKNFGKIFLSYEKNLMVYKKLQYLQEIFTALKKLFLTSYKQQYFTFALKDIKLISY